MSSNARRRARNLDDQTIEHIVKILDGWSSPKLTWELLIEEVLLRLRVGYTRQAFHSHTRIKEAFAARKIAIKGLDPQEIASLTPERQRIARLEAEVERLNKENNNLLEQFNRWVYNGYLKQMDERMRDFMIQPLPKVHRDPSEKAATAKGEGKRK